MIELNKLIHEEGDGRKSLEDPKGSHILIQIKQLALNPNSIPQSQANEKKFFYSISDQHNDQFFSSKTEKATLESRDSINYYSVKFKEVHKLDINSKQDVIKIKVYST